MAGTPTTSTRSIRKREASRRPDVGKPNTLRKLVGHVVESQAFETFMSVVIILNVVLMVIETNDNGRCTSKREDASACKQDWVGVANTGFLIMYTVELCLRIYVERVSFINTGWNYLDSFIVVCGWLDTFLAATVGALPGPSASLLRVFRVTRIARIMRIVSIFPELYALIRGFVGAMRSMFWGFMMILVFLVIFSILSVEILNPINIELIHDDEYCLEAFSSVGHAVLLFIQTLVAGDSWGYCAIPIIKKSMFASLVFITSLVCVQLGVTNLILAVIVEEANKAHEKDVENRMRMKENEQRLAAKRLKDDLKEIDEDKSGTINIKELRAGFDSHQSLQLQLQSLDIKREDLDDFFHMLDEQGDGELEYDRLIDSLLAAKMDDVGKQIMMLRLQTSEISATLAELAPTASKRVKIGKKRSDSSFEGSMETSEMRSAVGPEHFGGIFHSLKRKVTELHQDILTTIESWDSKTMTSNPTEGEIAGIPAISECEIDQMNVTSSHSITEANPVNAQVTCVKPWNRDNAAMFAL